MRNTNISHWSESLLKERSLKMFRLWFALILVVILGSFTNAENKPTAKVSDNTTQGNRCEKTCCNGRDGRDGRNGHNGINGRNGRNGMKGEKGDKGICEGPGGHNSTLGPSKSTMQFADTADNCTLHTAGTVRFNASRKFLELCDGSAWLPLVTAREGHVASNPGRHCLDILKSGHSHGSGFYWIDPNGGLKDDSFEAFCDMESGGGGWTLVATKVSPSFLFIRNKFSALAAKATKVDAASHIHPDMGDWREVMFRFADANTIRVIYNRKAGATRSGKKEFERFLMGKSANMYRDVFGFYKYGLEKYNQRSPAGGFAAISSLCFYTTHGISETHSGTDKWIDMWHYSDRSNNYVSSDDSDALGRKCIAGYCYLNKPIWVMVR